jgi:L,D-transpeptidase YcbB
MIARPLFTVALATASPAAFAQTVPPVVTPTLPPVAIPPAVVQTLPTAPLAAPLPTLSSSQAAFLAEWLSGGANQGLGGAKPGAALTGDALVRTVLDQARALRTGRIEKQDFLQIWAMRPTVYHPLADFTAAVVADKLPQWIATLTPPYAGYDGLRKGLAAYGMIRTNGGWPTLQAGASAAAIRARLAIEDKSGTTNESLGEAIQRAQRRYGLNPSGTLDARTVAALNVPVTNRIAAIMANMERWRWMPRALPTHRVQVNIAAAVLTVFEGDAPVTSMRAVTGRPGNETPMLTSTIHSIVINPPWNVPSSIAKAELFPQGRAALIRKGYQIVGTAPNERIIQPPGRGNALGQLKFDFDNPFAVYLHDTSARGGFSSFDRLASHGCIRLQKPVALAQRFLEPAEKWTPQVLQDAIDSGKTQRVALPEKIQVYLLYWTAFASTSGMMNFRDDPYGWDNLLATRIDAAARRAANPVARTVTTAQTLKEPKG